MKYDEFQQNQKLFIFGIICLVTCLSLLFFAVYILPFLAWDINYGVPLFLTTFITYLNEVHGYTTSSAKWVLEMCLIIPGLIAGLISYFISNYIDNQNQDIYPPPAEGEIDPEASENERVARRAEMRREMKETANFGMQLFFLLVGVVAILLILQALI